MRAASGLVEEAAAAGARLVALPETWAYKGASEGIRASAEPLDGPATAAWRSLAARLGVYVLAGSIYEPAPDGRHASTTRPSSSGRTARLPRRVPQDPPLRRRLGRHGLP